MARVDLVLGSSAYPDDEAAVELGSRSRLVDHVKDGALGATDPLRVDHHDLLRPVLDESHVLINRFHHLVIHL